MVDDNFHDTATWVAQSPELQSKADFHQWSCQSFGHTQIARIEGTGHTENKERDSQVGYII